MASRRLAQLGPVVQVPAHLGIGLRPHLLGEDVLKSQQLHLCMHHRSRAVQPARPSRLGPVRPWSSHSFRDLASPGGRQTGLHFCKGSALGTLFGLASSGEAGPHGERPPHGGRDMRRAYLSAAIGLSLTVVLGSTPGVAAADAQSLASIPTLSELRSARLKPSDLPSDYRRDYSGDSPGDAIASSTNPDCSRRWEARNRKTTAVSKVNINFRLERDTGPFVSNPIAVWEGRRAPKVLMHWYRKLVRDCDQWTQTYSDGLRMTIRLELLPMPAVGSERLAYRARLSARSGGVAVSARADFVAVRVHNAITRVGISSFFGGSGLDYVALGRTSAARLSATL